jgi:hypothetical protein
LSPVTESSRSTDTKEKEEDSKKGEEILRGKLGR